MLNVAIDLGIASAIVQLRANSGETHVDPNDPEIVHVLHLLDKDIGEAHRLADSAGTEVPRMLKDLLMLDSDLLILKRALRDRTSLGEVQQYIDSTSQRVRRLDKLASR